MISNDPNLKTERDIVGCHLVYNGKVLYVRRNPKKAQGNLWGSPAGKVQEGEDRISAIKREVKEEIGLELKDEDLEYLKTWKVVFNSQKKGCTYKSFSYSLYKVILDEEPNITLRNEELFEYGWFTPEEALRLPLVEDEDLVIKDIWNL